MTIHLTRADLEDVLKALVERCRGPIRDALEKSKLDPKDIDHVLFVGGPSYMPCVRRVVRDELLELGARKDVITEIDESIEINKFLVDPLDCVAQGAALVAAGLIRVEAKMGAEGYGVILRDDYYDSVIDEDFHCPITGDTVILFGDPNFLTLNIGLASKRKESGKTVYKNLGRFPISVQPTGKPPHISCVVEIDHNKNMILRLTHRESGQIATFRATEILTGGKIDLQEDSVPRSTDEELAQMTREFSNPRISWTKMHLERLIHVARKALELADSAAYEETAGAKMSLKSALEEAARNQYNEPNKDCPNISNRIAELFDALLTAKQITPDEFYGYVGQLSSLARLEQPVK